MNLLTGLSTSRPFSVIVLEVTAPFWANAEHAQSSFGNFIGRVTSLFFCLQIPSMEDQNSDSMSPDHP